jgi:hypothetical protein
MTEPIKLPPLPGCLAFYPLSDKVALDEYIRFAVEQATAEMRAENERLRVALQEMIDVDDEPCSFDRNGYCLSHYFDYDADGCRVAAARAALAKEKS